MGTKIIVDESTDGGKLRAAREAAHVSLGAIKAWSGYDTGYLSRIERNFFGVSSDILAAYEKVVGHPIGGIMITAQSIQEVQAKARSRAEKSSPSPRTIQQKHQHEFTLTVIADLTLIRWCRFCPLTYQVHRSTTGEPFADQWQQIKE